MRLTMILEAPSNGIEGFLTELLLQRLDDTWDVKLVTGRKDLRKSFFRLRLDMEWPVRMLEIR